MNDINTSHIAAARVLTARQLRPGSILASAPADAVRDGTMRTGSPDDHGDDHVELSSAGLALAELGGKDMPRPDALRIEKVARLRSEIQNGLYDVDAKIDAIVDRVLDDLVSY